MRLLVEARGLQALQLLLQREAVYQEARRLGVSVTQADVEREYRMTCEAAQFNGKQPEALTPARREKIIEEWTRSRGVPREELAVMVERQACLRKMAKAQIKITEEMLRDEYRRTYGEKVEVRHIQLAAERDFLQIRRRLARGDRFEDLVADYSRNNLSRERRGLLPPFSADDPGVPAIFAKVAFQLKPGEVSNPIEAEGSFHVLKLERRIPAQAVEFGEVKDALTHTLEARLLARQIEALGKRLYSRARLRITDPVLREQYKRRLTKGWIEGPPLTGP
ncbi:MAG: peptidylprolyl isomerase [Phycisphaerae bacterium]